MIRVFLFLLSLSFIQNSFSQQFYIRGQVTDVKSQLPLKNASVYINNTTKGAAADDNGAFELGPLPAGRYEVVASYVGYEPSLYSAEIKETGLRIIFKLSRKEIIMRELLVLNSETRKQYLEIFKNYVLGVSVAAEHCRVRNIEEVQFASGDNADEFLAYTERTLVIDNPELGYTVYFDLVGFSYNKATTNSYFFGYSRFVDWGKKEQSKKEWSHKRRQAYEGSTVHFFRSLVKKQLAQEGFTAYQLNSVQNKDTVVLETPLQKTKSATQIAPRAIEDSMIRMQPGSVRHIYELCLKDGWRITYDKNTKLKEEITRKVFITQPPSGTVSGLRLREGPVLINQRGVVLTPLRLLYDGIWSYERLANKLPEDYEVK